MTWEKQYLDLVQNILDKGEDRVDRTGTGTRAVFGRMLDIDVSTCFPLLTTKKVPFKAVVAELLWFIEGSADERRLAEIQHGTRDPAKTTIWTANAQADYWLPKAKFDGDLGRVYGKQWRTWSRPGAQEAIVDQLAEVIQRIRTNPTDRRLLVSAWNPGELDQMALPPCHYAYQFFAEGDGGLSMYWVQRSVDVGLGLPFNIASYALLLNLVAQVTKRRPHRLIGFLGDTHIYTDHVAALEEQLTREPLAAPNILINQAVDSIDNFTMSDIQLDGYAAHSTIAMKMST